MTMNEKYKQLLKEKKVKTAKVARETNIPYSTLNEWANGKTKKISADNLAKLADYFEVPITYFSGEDEEPSYYIDPEVAEIAQQLHDDPNMRGLFKAARNLPKEDILRFKEIIEGYERGYKE